jgi:hypothetical protein
MKPLELIVVEQKYTSLIPAANQKVKTN